MFNFIASFLGTVAERETPVKERTSDKIERLVPIEAAEDVYEKLLQRSPNATVGQKYMREIGSRYIENISDTENLEQNTNVMMSIANGIFVYGELIPRWYDPRDKDTARSIRERLKRTFNIELKPAPILNGDQSSLEEQFMISFGSVIYDRVLNQ